MPAARCLTAPLVTAAFLALTACTGTAATDPAAPSRDDTSAAREPAGPAHRVSFRFVRADGTVLAAPILVASDGELARCDVLRETRYVADVDVDSSVSGAPDRPAAVHATLGEGVRVIVLATEAPDRPGTLAVAFDVETNRVLGRPPRRMLRIAPAPADGIEVELLRIETTAFAGAQLVASGTEVAVAQFPADGGDVTLRLRVDANGSSAGPSPADVAPPDEQRAASLRSLAAAAVAPGARTVSFSFEEDAADDPRFACGTVSGSSDLLDSRVGTPDRPAGHEPSILARSESGTRNAAPAAVASTTDPVRDATAQAVAMIEEWKRTFTHPEPAGFRSATSSRSTSSGRPATASALQALPGRTLVTVAAPGAHIERRLDAAYVAEYSPRGASIDPQVATCTSGCDVNIGEDGKFHVRWTSAPRFLTSRVEPVRGNGADVERPLLARAAAATPVRPGETEFPMGAFTGGAGAIVRLTCHLEE